MTASTPRLTGRARRSRGSVLIIVLWICLGLVTLTLYFADSMNSELRAADNRVVEAASRQAIAAGIRYATYVLTQYAKGGQVPDVDSYQAEALPVGDANFSFLGRDPDAKATNEPYFALVDESSKLNLNTATPVMLAALPGMTSDLAAAIFNWRSTNASTADNTYGRLDPPRRNKSAPFETVDEVRLVYGASLEILLGEDTNRNGTLDANEDDGDQSAPHDDGDGQLLAGLLEYVTIYSSLPVTSASGRPRINVTSPQGRQQLAARLTQRGIAAPRAQAILAAVGNATLRSVAEFMVSTQMTADEFALIHTDVTTATGQPAVAAGLVNVNTASETVLACIPGIGTARAASLVAYRTAHPEALTSFAWLQNVLTRGDLFTAGPFITDQSYQFSADIVATGNNGRGYCREKVVFDMSTGTPRIVYRQDLTAAGWALGANPRRPTGNKRT